MKVSIHGSDIYLIVEKCLYNPNRRIVWTETLRKQMLARSLKSAAATASAEHCNLSGNVQQSNRNDARRDPQDALPFHRSARPCRSSKAAGPRKKDDRESEQRPGWAADRNASTANRTSEQAPCQNDSTNPSRVPAQHVPQFSRELPNCAKYARPAHSRAGGTARPPHTFWYWRSIASRHRLCQ